MRGRRRTARVVFVGAVAIVALLPGLLLLLDRANTRLQAPPVVTRNIPAPMCPHIDVERDLAFLAPYLSPHERRSGRALLNPDASWCPSGASERRQRLVFGLGLSKTGTTSLHSALEELGYVDQEGQPALWDEVVDQDASLDFWDPRVPLNQTGLVRRLRRFFQATDRPRSATDFPVPLFYDELLAAFPDALFVLTTRNVTEWYASARRQMPSPARNPYNVRNRLAAYSEGKAHPHMFPKRYVQHNKAVLRAIPCCQLLVTSLVDGDGWAKLAPFLGRAPPQADFPARRVWQPPSSTKRVGRALDAGLDHGAR